MQTPQMDWRQKQQGERMAFCPKCGAQIQDNITFCGSCGSSIAAPGTTTPPQAVSIDPGLSINGASALCYLFGFVTGIIFLVLAPYSQDKRVRFHAFQSIFFNVAVFVIHIGLMFITIMFHTVSFALGMLMSTFHMLVSLGFLLIWLYLMWKSYEGKKVVLPIIGPLAEKQAGA
jgi:uncharacterized membrane protein